MDDGRAACCRGGDCFRGPGTCVQSTRAGAVVTRSGKSINAHFHDAVVRTRTASSRELVVLRARYWAAHLIFPPRYSGGPGAEARTSVVLKWVAPCADFKKNQSSKIPFLL